jgi:hypothetical protein
MTHLHTQLARRTACEKVMMVCRGVAYAEAATRAKKVERRWSRRGRRARALPRHKEARELLARIAGFVNPKPKLGANERDARYRKTTIPPRFDF